MNDEADEDEEWELVRGLRWLNGELLLALSDEEEKEGPAIDENKRRGERRGWE